MYLSDYVYIISIYLGLKLEIGKAKYSLKTGY